MQNAIAIIDKARANGALVYAPQNLDTPPLYKAEATIIQAKPEEFFNIQGKFMPSKAVVDRIGEAAGVDFIAAQCSVNTELREDDFGKRTVFIGSAQGRTRLPDGSWRTSTVEEYEFDPLLRAKMEAKGDSDVPRKYMELAKVARQRASTGARVRVIRQLTGMPVTFTQADVSRPLVFSRIVQNTDFILETKEGRAMAIAAAVGVTHQLFGPGPSQEIKQVEQPLDFDGLRNVSPPAAETDPFGDDFSPVRDPRAEELLAILGEWAESDSAVASRAKAIIDRGETDVRVLEASVSLCKYIASGFLRENGVNTCLDTLDRHGTDAAALEGMVLQAKKAHDARAKGGAA